MSTSRKLAQTRRKTAIMELVALSKRATTVREVQTLRAMVADLEAVQADPRFSGAEKDQKFRNILTRAS